MKTDMPTCSASTDASVMYAAFVTEMCLFFSVIAGLQQDCNTEGRPGQESMKQSRPHAEEDFGQQ